MKKLFTLTAITIMLSIGAMAQNRINTADMPKIQKQAVWVKCSAKDNPWMINDDEKEDDKQNLRYIFKEAITADKLDFFAWITVRLSNGSDGQYIGKLPNSKVLSSCGEKINEILVEDENSQVSKQIIKTEGDFNFQDYLMKFTSNDGNKTYSLEEILPIRKSYGDNDTNLSNPQYRIVGSTKAEDFYKISDDKKLNIDGKMLTFKEIVSNNLLNGYYCDSVSFFPENDYIKNYIEGSLIDMSQVKSADKSTVFACNVLENPFLSRIPLSQRKNHYIYSDSVTIYLIFQRAIENNQIAFYNHYTDKPVDNKELRRLLGENTEIINIKNLEGKFEVDTISTPFYPTFNNWFFKYKLVRGKPTLTEIYPIFIRYRDDDVDSECPMLRFLYYIKPDDFIKICGDHKFELVNQPGEYTVKEIFDNNLLYGKQFGYGNEVNFATNDFFYEEEPKTITVRGGLDKIYLQSKCRECEDVNFISTDDLKATGKDEVFVKCPLFNNDFLKDIPYLADSCHISLYKNGKKLSHEETKNALGYVKDIFKFEDGTTQIIEGFMRDIPHYYFKFVRNSKGNYTLSEIVPVKSCNDDDENYIIVGYFKAEDIIKAYGNNKYPIWEQNDLLTFEQIINENFLCGEIVDEIFSQKDNDKAYIEGSLIDMSQVKSAEKSTVFACNVLENPFLSPVPLSVRKGNYIHYDSITMDLIFQRAIENNKIAFYDPYTDKPIDNKDLRRLLGENTEIVTFENLEDEIEVDTIISQFDPEFNIWFFKYKLVHGKPTLTEIYPIFIRYRDDDVDYECPIISFLYYIKPDDFIKICGDHKFELVNQPGKYTVKEILDNNLLYGKQLGYGSEVDLATKDFYYEKEPKTITARGGLDKICLQSKCLECEDDNFISTDDLKATGKIEVIVKCPLFNNDVLSEISYLADSCHISLYVKGKKLSHEATRIALGYEKNTVKYEDGTTGIQEELMRDIPYYYFKFVRTSKGNYSLSEIVPVIARRDSDENYIVGTFKAKDIIKAFGNNKYPIWEQNDLYTFKQIINEKFLRGEIVNEIIEK